jgi:hypothetical protein
LVREEHNTVPRAFVWHHLVLQFVRFKGNYHPRVHRNRYIQPLKVQLAAGEIAKRDNETEPMAAIM